jgi:nitrogen fixation NifU-like protein
VKDDLAALYRDVIVDHGNRPRNHQAIERSTGSAEGANPLCGDEITVYVRVDDGVIDDIGFESQGCSISTASASLMTEALIGKSVEEALLLFEDVHAMLAKSPANVRSLGKLDALAGVAAYPMRVKCATLAWHTMREAVVGHPAVTASGHAGS